MFAQQFRPRFQIGAVGWRQFKFHDDATEGDQQMQSFDQFKKQTGGAPTLEGLGTINGVGSIDVSGIRGGLPVCQSIGEYFRGTRNRCGNRVHGPQYGIQPVGCRPRFCAGSQARFLLVKGQETSRVDDLKQAEMTLKPLLLEAERLQLVNSQIQILNLQAMAQLL